MKRKRLPRAANQVELAKALGVHRRTIHRWLKEPGNPGLASNGSADIAAWLSWKIDRGLGMEEEDPTKAAVEKRILEKREKLLEIEIARRLDEVTDNDKLIGWVAEMVGAAKTVLLAIPGILAPQVVGMSIPDAERRIREAIDEALTQLHREPWNP